MKSCARKIPHKVALNLFEGFSKKVENISADDLRTEAGDVLFLQDMTDWEIERFYKFVNDGVCKPVAAELATKGKREWNPYFRKENENGYMYSLEIGNKDFVPFFKRLKKIGFNDAEAVDIFFKGKDGYGLKEPYLEYLEQKEVNKNNFDINDKYVYLIVPYKSTWKYFYNGCVNIFDKSFEEDGCYTFFTKEIKNAKVYNTPADAQSECDELNRVKFLEVGTLKVVKKKKTVIK